MRPFSPFVQTRNTRGGGGGGTHNIFGWGCAARSWKPLPQFRPKYTISHTLFQTLPWKCIPYFRPCDVWQIRQLSIDLRRTGVRDAPNDVRVFFFAINVYGTHVTLKTVSQTRRNIHPTSDQNGKIYTLFQTRNARKWYPLGRHIPIWHIYGSNPPPPPPGRNSGGKITHVPPRDYKILQYKQAVYSTKSAYAPAIPI